MGIYLGKIICESSNWQQIQRLTIIIIGANWQFLDWKGLPNVHIIVCLQNHEDLLICVENTEIYVANLMMQ